MTPNWILLDLSGLQIFIRTVPELNVGGGLGGTYFSPPSPTKKNCERPIKKIVT
jgi:hypothetical protein